MSLKKVRKINIILTLVLLFIGCVGTSNSGLNQNTNLISNTSGESVDNALNICLGYEPQSLYLYGSNSQAARDVLAAIYDGPIDIIDNQPQPVILQKLPALQDGDAYFNPLGVEPGDEIIDADGNLVTLAEGVELFPRDCRSQECIITYDGQSPLQMDELVVTYILLAGIQWSDGTPLTAADAVYSFQLAADADTPTLKRYTDQVASYQAIDELTVQMVSKPGLVPRELHKYFWTPLPQHAWGQYSAAELLAAEVSVRKPIGWGPYLIEEWIPGESIHLAKNPFYFRANEGLPKNEIINFHFKSEEADTNINSLEFDREYYTIPGLTTTSEAQPKNTVICHLANKSIDFSGEYEAINDLLNLFIEPAIQAFKLPNNKTIALFVNTSKSIPESIANILVHCIDIRSIIHKAFYFQAFPGNVFSESQTRNIDPREIQDSFDPIDGIQDIETIGWLKIDTTDNSPRRARDIAGIKDGSQLEMDLIYITSNNFEIIVDELVKSLSLCGFQINPMPFAPEVFLNPEESFFDTSFDLALYPWMIDNAGNPIGEEIFFDSEISIIPLVNLVDVTIASLNLRGYQLDSTKTSDLWNIENFYLEK